MRLIVPANGARTAASWARCNSIFAAGLERLALQSPLTRTFGLARTGRASADGSRANGGIFILDSLLVPVCKRVRARRCRKVRGLDFCGYCAAKKEKFFGWRLHLICTPQGRPVSYTLLAGRYQDLTPVHELTVVLPPGVTV